MKFKTHYEKPLHGTARLRKVFAWLPVYISTYKVWLCNYEILQVYLENKTTVIIEGKEAVFINGSWVNLSKRII